MTKKRSVLTFAAKDLIVERTSADWLVIVSRSVGAWAEEDVHRKGSFEKTVVEHWLVAV
jgi:hypothetical protein